MYTVDRERVVDGERFPYDVDICLAEELMRAHARKRGVELGSTSGKGTRNVFEEVRLALAAAGWDTATPLLDDAGCRVRWHKV